MENLHRWDRDDKLFAVKTLKISAHADRGQYLLQLVVDDDPVVRGKSALALKTCSDTILLEAAETLLEDGEAEKQILACELLGFTEEIDVSEQLEPLLDASDHRVRRSAVDVLRTLSDPTALNLLETVIDQYDENLAKPVFRVLETIQSPDLLTVLQRLFNQVENKNKKHLLRIGANLQSNDARDWVSGKIERIEISDHQQTVIDWLLTTNRPMD